MRDLLAQRLDSLSQCFVICRPKSAPMRYSDQRIYRHAKNPHGEFQGAVARPKVRQISISRSPAMQSDWMRSHHGMMRGGNNYSNDRPPFDDDEHMPD